MAKRKTIKLHIYIAPLRDLQLGVFHDKLREYRHCHQLKDEKYNLAIKCIEKSVQQYKNRHAVPINIDLKFFMKRKGNHMNTGRDAARYLFSLDYDNFYFNTNNLITNCSATFYEGNARLNKILHLAQNMYIGKTGEKLIDEDFYAYDNGGVLIDVQENYSMLLGTKNRVKYSLDEYIKDYLHRTFIILKDAPISKLIEIDREDPAWIEKHNYYYKEDKKMDSLKYADDYASRYEAANFYMDNLELPC